jgi:hypothetical protein
MMGDAYLSLVLTAEPVAARFYIAAERCQASMGVMLTIRGERRTLPEHKTQWRRLNQRMGSGWPIRGPAVVQVNGVRATK